MNTKIFLALLLCSAALCSSNNCPGFFGGDLLESGKYAIIHSSPPGQPLHKYTAPVSFTIPNTGLDIAVTTSTIAGYNPVVQYGFNYALSGKRSTSGPFVDFELIVEENNSWQSIQLSYIFSGRTDLAIGNFEVDYFFWKPLSTGVFQVTHAINKVLPANQEYQIAAFLSGFSTASSEFTASINQLWYEQQTKQLGVIFNYKSNPNFLYIAFSYIIYPRNHFSLKMVYDPTPSADSGSYQISGPVDFEGNSIVYNEWRVENRNIPCNGAKCNGRSCTLLEDCNTNGGNFWQGQCYYCNDGIVFDNGQCSRRRCGANQVLFNRICICQPGFLRDGLHCVADKSCGTNEEWDDSTNKCICDQNSALWSAECRRCPAQSFPNAARTSCVCVDPGQEFDQLTNTCKNRCGPSQLWKDTQCVCIPQFSWWNKACRQCPSDSVPNAQQTTCECQDPLKIYDADANQCKFCPTNFVPKADKTGCVCRNGYVLDGSNVCVLARPICTPTQVYNPSTNACDCKFGFTRLAGTCVSRCGTNEAWTGSVCVCIDNHARYNGQPCRPCPAGTSANQERTTCLCNDVNSIFIPNRLLCERCQPNSTPSADDTVCVCNAGWTQSGSTCVSSCQSNATPDSQGVCTCNKGYYEKDGKCLLQPVCPDRSEWNQAALECICTNPLEHIINGACRLCPSNEGWNGVECVCKSGFFRVNNQCVTCDPRSKYNGKECICNLGLYGNGITCSPCHPSCSKCSGPNANQCAQCADISLTLKNGFCTKIGPCNPGLYLDGSSCVPCSENCRSCSGPFDCSKCIDGFEPLELPFGGQPIISCSEVCGDGKRFTDFCDDGNLDNGDGCDEFCEIESGWDCNGGGSTRRDNCVQKIPENVVLSQTGAANLGTVVVQQVRASYLPPCVTNFDCQNCPDVLDVKVVSSLNYVSLSVNYNPFTKYQWVVRVEFNEIVTSAFKLVIKLNEKYKNYGANCFKDSDFNQQLEIAILEPTYLVRYDSEEAYTG